MPQRLSLLLASLVLAAAPAAALAAEDGGWRHATALIGEPKYPPDFKHFDYVDPNAPKGGLARLSDVGTFDTLNPVLPKGTTPLGLGLVFETLMTPALDERSTMYGLLAKEMRHPDDFSSVTFRLDPDAKWHDGKPVTAEDVVWSFQKTTEVNPSQRFYYQRVAKVEATGEREVTFTFTEKNNRELPHIAGQVLVMPKHWWTAEGRDIAEGTLDPPLGSGPYRVGRVIPGRSVTYERVDGYWGADHPVNVGQNNFDQVRYEFFRDDTVEFEAFKADQYDWRDENEAKRWATAYDFPAVKKGFVVQETFENPYRDSGIMVGFIPNLRREPFKDRRFRKALNLAFDFEELNRTIFFDQYQRIDSFFYDIPLRSEGLPEGEEREILLSLGDDLPPGVLTEPYENPVNGSASQRRKNLREAVRLLTEAGYTQRDGKLIDPKTGRPVSFELLLNGPVIERVALPYQKVLRRLGIDMRVRSVDTSQYINRVRGRDFDMIYTGWAQSSSPGNEQRDYWGSEAADNAASRNYAGIKDPLVDKLIEKVVLADDRETLVAATKALDRVLLWNQFVIPSYTIRKSRIARWDRFGRPEPLPEFSVGFPSVWWWDEEKARRIGAAK